MNNRFSTLLTTLVLAGTLGCIRVAAQQQRGGYPQPKEFTTVDLAGYPKFTVGLPTRRPPPLPVDALEAGPSNLDHEGNWGELVRGWRLSVRSTKSQYRLGEPIAVIVILRNEANQRDGVFLYKTVDSPISHFKVEDSHGEKIETSPKVTFHKSIPRRDPPMTQYRTWTRLDSFLDLDQAGRYHVRGEAPVPVRSTSSDEVLGFTNVVSGFAEFEILPSTGPAEKQEE